MRKARRSATVRALTRTSLLVLDARDVHILMEQEPKIAQRIREMARQRVEPETVEARGDLATEELVATDGDAEGTYHRLRANGARDLITPRPAHPAV